jgi:hypothetical protein
MMRRLLLAAVAALTITGAKAMTPAEAIDVYIENIAVDYAIAAQTAKVCGLPYPTELNRRLRAMVMEHDPKLLVKVITSGNKQEELQAKVNTMCGSGSVQLYESSRTKIENDLGNLQRWLARAKS